MVAKSSKERMTVLLCCSAAGEKLHPLVIRRSQTPRCFRGYTGSLPVTYKANRRAWMTKDMFSEWLYALNNKMRAQKRSILLLLDNCSTHPNIKLSNIKLVFLPPHTTSHLQPCDGGIIQAVKLRNRTKFVRLLKIDEANTASELEKWVTLLDAIL